MMCFHVKATELPFIFQIIAALTSNNSSFIALMGMVGKPVAKDDQKLHC